MKRIISIVNQKGGSGKTTTAINLFYGLNKKGFKTLLIDLDSQGNATDQFINEQPKATALEIFTSGRNIQDLIQHTPQGDIIASHYNLLGLDVILKQQGKEGLLKKAIATLKDYEYIIIDTSPILNLTTINALNTSNYAIITAQADIFTIKSIQQINNTITEIKRTMNPELNILGILLTRYNGRTTLTQILTNNIKETAQDLNIRVFQSAIRENTAIKEAQAIKRCIYDYAKASNGAKDYMALTEEIIQITKE